jgi:hypothetical protein
MKILYLDFDGVLHDATVWFPPGRDPYIDTSGRVLFEWMPILEKILAAAPDVRIVISSSWAAELGLSAAKNRLSNVLQQRVIGSTFDYADMDRVRFSHTVRGRQVMLDVAARRADWWIAVDDDSRGWPEDYLDRLILTRGATGLSDPHVQERLRWMLARFEP